jgi:3'-phosphoadenosine 5'-phosphosulfate sulfotransferase (PAPS reductase)/FAD synthetase
MSQINVISMSGGKDSTATALLAIEQGGDNRYLFADTGHEHQITYEYLDYLEQALGITIERLRPDFSAQVIRKREIVRTKWVEDGACTPEEAEEICSYLVPSGNPFLDLCMWKGRFPSNRARFCSQELKHHPLDMRMLEMAKEGDIVSWQGVRAQESPARAKLTEREPGDYYEIYRPILKWTWEEVFAKHDEHGIKPNPLYSMGMSRVGCMPCIHARKSELSAIGNRCPDEVDRVSRWEAQVSMAAKRGKSTFFASDIDPMNVAKDNAEVSIETHGIHNVIDWANTARGGRQRDIFANDVPLCASAYGLCE